MRGERGERGREEGGGGRTWELVTEVWREAEGRKYMVYMESNNGISYTV